MSDDAVKIPAPVSGVGGWLDDRFHGAKGVRVLMKKVFPDHWSFMLGEIALWSFVILLLTGTYLALFFQPSSADVIYHGSYAKLDGVHMSLAYAVDAEPLVRHPRRPADAADPPLGRDHVHGRDHGAHAPGVLHRRVPQAA